MRSAGSRTTTNLVSSQTNPSKNGRQRKHRCVGYVSNKNTWKLTGGRYVRDSSLVLYESVTPKHDESVPEFPFLKVTAVATKRTIIPTIGTPHILSFFRCTEVADAAYDCIMVVQEFDNAGIGLLLVAHTQYQEKLGLNSKIRSRS